MKAELSKRIIMTEPKQKKRTRRKRTKRLYFTQVHEDAILEYCASRDRKKRRFI